MPRVSERVSGFKDHTLQNERREALAFVNIGLPGENSEDRIKRQKIGPDPEGEENLKEDSELSPQEESDYGEVSGGDSGVPEHVDEINTESPADAIEDEIDSGEASGEDSGSEKQMEESKAIGFALVQSASMLPELTQPKRAMNSIANARIDTMQWVCTKEDVKALEEIRRHRLTVKLRA